jgi:integrase/recombinase XerC
MDLRVVRSDGSHRLAGGPIEELANAYLAHLESRGFSPGTVRGYAFDLLNFGRFLSERRASVVDVVATDLFDYLDWQSKPRSSVVGFPHKTGPSLRSFVIVPRLLELHR